MDIFKWINTTYTVNWTALEALGTLIASVIAVFTLLYLIRQLTLEQEPFVAARDDISYVDDSRGEHYCVKLKNVGRGPALNITGCQTENENNRNNAFFLADQPHSKNLCANNADDDGEKHWRIGKNVIDSLESKTLEHDIYKTFYFFYESQLGDIYFSKIKMKVDNNCKGKFIVMDNKRVRLWKFGRIVIQPQYFFTNVNSYFKMYINKLKF